MIYQNKISEKKFMDKNANPTDSYEHYNELLHLFKIKGGERVMEFGCGYNPYGIHLTKMGCKVTCIDIRKKIINFNNKFYRNIVFKQADIECLSNEFRNFDMVFCGNVLHHFLCLDLVLKNAKRCLKKGGRVIAVEPNGSNPLIGWYFNEAKRKGCLSESEYAHTPAYYQDAFNKIGFKNTKITYIRKATSPNKFKWLISWILPIEIVITSEVK